MNIKRWLQNSWLQGALFLISGGFISMALKFELIWDFAQYHYYNAWSFVEGRFNHDLLTAGYNGFFNPLMDLPLYFLIKYFNDYPNFIYFMQGLWFGALAFILFKIAQLFFDKKLPIFFTLLLGLCGYGVFFQIGTSSNEIMISFLLLLSLYLLLRVLCGQSEARGKLFFIAGLSAGAAMGLKLTAVIYCAAFGAALISFYKKIPSSGKNISLFALGGFFGFAVFSGFWLWRCWQAFENPFFPFANEFFQSPYWNGGNYTDDRFVPKNWLAFLLLPFNLHRGEGFSLVVDFRLALMYLALTVVIVHYFWKSRSVERISWNWPLMFVIAFMTFAYLIWIYYFGIARYMLPIEILCGLVLTKAAIYFMPQTKRNRDIYEQFLSAMVILLLLNPLFSEHAGCRNCELDNQQFNQFVEVKNVRLPDNALVMFYRYPYNFPVSALLAYWGQSVNHLRGIEATPKNYAEGFFAGKHWNEEKKRIIKEHKGETVVVLAVENVKQMQFLQQREKFLQNLVCKELEANFKMAYYTYFLCAKPSLSEKIWHHL